MKQNLNHQSKQLFFGLLILLLVAACNEEKELLSMYQGKTVLVYMVADNNLNGTVDKNIDSMAIGLKNSTISGNLLIYLDGQDQLPQLIQLVREADGRVTQKIVKTYVEQNSVSPKVMASVLKEVAEEYPSQSYGLVLWSHGYGWLPGSGNTKAISTRWFGQDGGYYMDVPDLVTALNAGPHFDYIMFDACFMGGIETTYALRRCTDYIIASPTEVIADGFPYSDIVSSLFGSTEADYIQVAKLFYEHYNAFPEAGRSASVGCIKCSELESLASQTAKLITAHATALNTFSASGVQCLESYSPHLFYDLGAFVKTFTEQESTVFEEQLNKAVVYKACTPKILSVSVGGVKIYIPINEFSGLNTYIPQSGQATRNTTYHSFEWYMAAGWNNTQW